MTNEQRMLQTLWRIVASDPHHSNFAVLVLSEVRQVLEQVTGEPVPVLESQQRVRRSQIVVDGSVN